ncbi:unnamed protein product [Nesidiocoris tenuis]|uniref:Uncharacterized protein n=1 Tax=Nesidiocoris tenuis TaxID=355587 RepID=A0A6H5HQA1_9HEMI|nr:unnamed protein product [Nesidiocoris tenuis]
MGHHVKEVGEVSEPAWERTCTFGNHMNRPFVLSVYCQKVTEIFKINCSSRKSEIPYLRAVFAAVHRNRSMRQNKFCTLCWTTKKTFRKISWLWRRSRQLRTAKARILTGGIFSKSEVYVIQQMYHACNHMRMTTRMSSVSVRRKKLNYRDGVHPPTAIRAQWVAPNCSPIAQHESSYRISHEEDNLKQMSKISNSEKDCLYSLDDISLGMKTSLAVVNQVHPWRNVIKISGGEATVFFRGRAWFDNLRDDNAAEGNFATNRTAKKLNCHHDYRHHYHNHYTIKINITTTTAITITITINIIITITITITITISITMTVTMTITITITITIAITITITITITIAIAITPISARPSPLILSPSLPHDITTHLTPLMLHFRNLTFGGAQSTILNVFCAHWRKPYIIAETRPEIVSRQRRRL